MKCALLKAGTLGRIGKVALIKSEDAGDAYYTGPEILIPDFRVVTADRAQLLIEVKTHLLGNSFAKPLKLTDRYIRRLLS